MFLPVARGDDLEGDVDIETGHKKRRDSAASHTTTKSAYVDFHSIYGWKSTPVADQQGASNSCCKMS